MIRPFVARGWWVTPCCTDGEEGSESGPHHFVIVVVVDRDPLGAVDVGSKSDDDESI